MGSIVEEMLELGGALLIGLSAAIALRGNAASRSPPGVLGPSWRVPLVGSMAVVVVLGSLAVVFTFRVLLIDARAVTHLDTFELRLRAQEAVVQEVHMPAYPIGRLDFRLVQRDPNAIQNDCWPSIRWRSPRQGIGAWLLAAAFDATQPTLPTGQDHVLQRRHRSPR